MDKATTGKLELVVVNELLASWMTINNCVPGWSVNDRPTNDFKDRFWNGCLFKLPMYFKNFPTGEWVYNPGSIVIKSDTGGEKIISADDLKQGTWVQVVVGTEARAGDPVSIGQAWACLKGTLHHYVDPFPGGILVWDGRSPFTLQSQTLTESDYLSRYTFTFQTGDGFKVTVHKADDPNPTPITNVTVIEIHGGPGGNSSPIINPPQS
jgi:hypothetical protein